MNPLLRWWLYHHPVTWLREQFAYRPDPGQTWDWHRWLHLRWWRIWLTTEACPRCGHRRQISVTETLCIFCQETNFGYPAWRSV